MKLLKTTQAIIFVFAWTGLFGSTNTAAGRILFNDDFQAYDVEQPSDFSIGGIPSGNWTADYDPAVSRSNEIYNTINFGGTRLWVSIGDNASLISRGIEGLQSGKSYMFRAVLCAETSSETRTVLASYDLLLGQDAASAASIIHGPIFITAHGDGWQIPNSKTDHLFIHDFTPAAVNPGDRLFIKITRISSSSAAFLGVDDVCLTEIQPIEIIASDTVLTEGGPSAVYDIYVKGSPAEAVSVTVIADDQVRVNGQSEVTLVFTPPIDPAAPQTVTVTAIDDNFSEGVHTGLITHRSSSVLADYDGLNLPSVEFEIADNDLPVMFVSNVFVGGQEGPQGTSNYRIPSMTVAPDGSILAFAEGRRNSADPGAVLPIDMVMKRSVDNGQTWQPLVVLHHNSSFDYSDPRPVTDLLTGKIHLLYTQWPNLCGQSCVPAGLGDNSSVVFLQTSEDNGLTWSGPINLNTQVKNPTWKALNSGPGHGIQLRWQTNPTRNGRLLAPCHINGVDAVSVYSDDGGLSWQSGTVDTTAPSLNESDVVELTNGDLLWDARQGSGLYRYRLKSTDGGQTWQYLGLGDIYITPVDCGIDRYSARRDGHDRDRIVFSGPLGSPIGTPGRYNLAVWTSYDEGKTFINPIQINNGFAAYSDIKRLANGRIGVIYEETGSTLIRFASCNIDVFENGPHDPALTQYDGFGNAVDIRRGGVGWTGSWTGLGSFTRSACAAFRGSSIPFERYRFTNQPGRVDSVAGSGMHITRLLNSPFDMHDNGTIYLSLLVSRALDTTANNDSEEDLNIMLQDSSQQPYISFGVNSREAFYVGKPGSVITTADNAVAMDCSYLMIAKIITKPDQDDRIYLKVLRSGADAVAGQEMDIDWTLIGASGENAAAVLDRICITAGANAVWSVDEVRIGTTYYSVAGRPDCSQSESYLPGDINRDCYVNLNDLVLLVNDWLSPGCSEQGIYPQIDINGDCDVNMDDMAGLAAGWLDCTDPYNPTECRSVN